MTNREQHEIETAAKRRGERVPDEAPATPWAAATNYLVGQRVSNGGKTYLCSTPGLSAASGGPTGTAGDVIDGTVHWEYLFSAEPGSGEYAVGDAVAWTPSTPFKLGQRVVNAAKVYECIAAGTSGDQGGTGKGPMQAAADVMDGSAHWKFIGIRPATGGTVQAIS